MDNSVFKEKKDVLPFTGERMVSQLIEEAGIKEDVFDHLHRYARAMDLVDGLDVLDIASGEGYGSNLLSKRAKTVIGVDISDESVAFAKHKYQQNNLEFLVGSADAMPLPDKSVDVVVSFETLEHHDKHDEMLAEIKRVLRPGGIMIMSTPDIDTYKDKGGINHYHVKELNMNEFRSLVEKHFKYYDMYVQRFVLASLIVLQGNYNEAVGFKEYQGDFDSIVGSDEVQYPYYNICIASDQKIMGKYNSVFHNYKQAIYSHEELENIVKYEVERSIASVLESVYKSREHRYGSIAAKYLRPLVKFFK